MKTCICKRKPGEFIVVEDVDKPICLTCKLPFLEKDSDLSEVDLHMKKKQDYEDCKYCGYPIPEPPPQKGNVILWNGELEKMAKHHPDSRLGRIYKGFKAM